MVAHRLLTVSPNLPCAMERDVWSLDDYYIGQTLYSGYAAQVYTATCKYSGAEVVLKVYNDVDKAPDVAQHEMYREVAIQASLHHPNVVHLFGAFEEGDTLVLVQEYVPNGDLLGLMQRHGGRIDEATVVKLVLRPLLGALLHLHRWGIVHRDIKPENVLFAADGSIKLADFGLAINMVEERPVSRVGTLDYMAPEVLRCPIKQSMAMAPGPDTPPKYGYATDAWAVGIVTYELLTGLPPYASDCRYQAESRICAALPPLFPHYVSPPARDFMLRLLAPHPTDRPTIREALEHPWVVNPEACTSHHHPARVLQLPRGLVISPAALSPAQQQQAGASPSPQGSPHPYSSPYGASPCVSTSPQYGSHHHHHSVQQPYGVSPSHALDTPSRHEHVSSSTPPGVSAKASPPQYPHHYHPHPHQQQPHHQQSVPAARGFPPTPLLLHASSCSPPPSHATTPSTAAAAACAPSAPAGLSPAVAPLPPLALHGAASWGPSQVSPSSHSSSDTDLSDSPSHHHHHHHHHHILALQDRQLSDLSDLPLEQIQGMIQKLQHAMQLAVDKQQRQRQQQHQQAGSPAAAAGDATPVGGAHDDVHMDDIRVPAPPPAPPAAPAVRPSSVARGCCLEPGCLQSSCNSPVVPSPAGTFPACSPYGLPASSNPRGATPPSHLQRGSSPGMHHHATGTATATASLPLPIGPAPNSAAAAAALTAAAPEVVAVRRTTADVPAYPAMPADAAAAAAAAISGAPVHQHQHQHPSLPQPYPHHETQSPPGYLGCPHPLPQSPESSSPSPLATPQDSAAGMGMGVGVGVGADVGVISPAGLSFPPGLTMALGGRSSGGGGMGGLGLQGALQEGDGLVYVSIGSSRRKVGEGARCEVEVLGSARSALPLVWFGSS